MSDRRAFVVVGLGFGDEGKGTIVDALVRRHGSDLVVRHNGGCQAGHNVVLPDGRHHTFAQWGSGTFVEGCRTYLSRFMIVNPAAMVFENTMLQGDGVLDAFERMYIDERCLISTPFHQAANRLREMSRRADRHGSCGEGIGETVKDSLEVPSSEVLRVHHIENSDKLNDILHATQQRKRAECADLIHVFRNETGTAAQACWMLEEPEAIEKIAQLYRQVYERANIVRAGDEPDLLKSAKVPVFEGAQGVLLDEWKGFHPFTTWSTTTSQNAKTILNDIDYHHPVEVIGVTRSYHTRHGAGPFPTEVEMREGAGRKKHVEEVNWHAKGEHNVTTQWQEHFRVGHLDEVLLRYAIQADGFITQLAITHMDSVMYGSRSWQHGIGYKLDGKDISGITTRDSHGALSILERQQAVGEMLDRCEPIIQQVTWGPVAYAERSSNFLRHMRTFFSQPIGITSWGNTHDHKKFAEDM
jgi:adenylosuccinate synthase